MIRIRGVCISLIIVVLRAGIEVACFVYIKCMLPSAFLLIIVCCCINDVMVVSVWWGYAKRICFALQIVNDLIRIRGVVGLLCSLCAYQRKSRYHTT